MTFVIQLIFLENLLWRICAMRNEPQFSQAPVCVGIDAGFYGTKLSFRREGSIVNVGFPSVAPPLPDGLSTTLEGLSANDSDLKINVGGTVYLVDTNDDGEVRGSVLRTENDSFPLTNEHTALVYAALVRSGHRRIDQLVLGLPLHTFKRYAGQLMQRFRGSHDFGYGAFTIGNVAVLPQPVGTFTYVRTMQPGYLKADTPKCIIDVGWGTSDVFVSSEKLQIDHSRCDGVPSGGAAAVVREVSLLLRSEFGGRFTNLDLIDRAMRTGQPLQHNGAPIDLSDFFNRVAHITVPVARVILTRLRTAEDLTVLVTGGGARYYLPALQETLGCPVTVVNDPRFANATGFLFAGEANCRK
ncbi:hypothetical protein PEP31012_01837 [Pandoraea eparura]|uniref:Actin-like protein N-terminal domain-containing protein n=1 Tax=Pandoraea eparura TaxID=2508291 RepID=A0A5E4U785_9BURK|nr:ParM/StbA family protein [Pandoraea eparura]VVD95601.1 hypothetical protein PEP31012_01837 [Pandoraea eparura]